MKLRERLGNKIRKILMKDETGSIWFTTSEGYRVILKKDGRILFVDPNTGAFVHPER